MTEGDPEDDQTFKKLDVCFKQHFPESGKIRFDGFDCDDNFVWFYFIGPDEGSVRQAVFPLLDGCTVRPGSYFVSNATQVFASLEDGHATLLSVSAVMDGPSSVR
jgi:hypothetical protein